MRTLRSILVLSVMAIAPSALAQSGQNEPPTAAPGVISGGSNNVTIGNMPAARDGDRTTDRGTVTGTSPNVYINGRPAVTTGDRTDCGGIVVGSGGVFINGKPAGRTGDLTSGCATK